ncbi:serine/arginine-rich splicing factor RS31A-like isoform X1 [Cucurbita maxima]|uniref:Serine/arginine-rich splicing factor RS31A-like isoform X1 n=1 Tax=Cucurbita maxima TaxID=3661 RepID=A0A6J1IQE3_CUCMA|nr:serine/arginine-rich splicing factor RS31A-like isoform X1 [Cucurbita maxima]XP_022979303.1 serine/arginine-rich splicing factor RS31A-like isoform X1 [Cucurbita maxima]
MRPIFVGNFGYDTRQSELERLFAKYGRVERIDMKSGFAFVYFEEERDAEDSIRSLDNMPFGYDRRRLSVEWARGERGRSRDGSKSMANQRPTKTLFVINFDPIRTRVRDIERHFEPYGKVLNVRIRRNFAFVQFETQEEATKALECTHMSKILDRVVSVEYALRDDGERGDHYDDSPRRAAYGRLGDSPYRRSPSPVYHRRPSPDYGRARSPAYDRYNGPYERRRSPDYGRNRSPEFGRNRSPEVGRNRSPEFGRNRSPEFGRNRSPEVGRNRSPEFGRNRSPEFGRNRSPEFGRNRSPEFGRNRSPEFGRNRSPEYGSVRSRSPIRRSRT